VIRPGVALAAGGAVVLTWLMAWVVTRRRTARVVAAPAIANAWRAAHSPAFRRAWRRYVGGLVLAGVAGGLGLGASVVLAGRPSARQVDERVTGTRDIMLCLDVSGSMMKFQSGLVAAFRRLVGSLHGDRVGLTMWDSTAISAFPLTDDYRYVDEQLAEAAAALDRHNFQYVVGTDAAEGSSLVGDGLASCAERFDRRAERRTRSIVLATDNQPNGVPVVTLAQAGAAVRALGAQIFAVAPEGGDPLRMDELRAGAVRRLGERPRRRRRRRTDLHALGQPDAPAGRIAGHRPAPATGGHGACRRRRGCGPRRGDQALAQRRAVGGGRRAGPGDAGRSGGGGHPPAGQGDQRRRPVRGGHHGQHRGRGLQR
jgi:hypothetical protein